MPKRKRRPLIVARSKRAYPTKRRAIDSLESAGICAYDFHRAVHTGTYWRWELKPGVKLPGRA